VTAALTFHVVAASILLDGHTTTFGRAWLSRIFDNSVAGVVLCALLVVCTAHAPMVEWYIVYRAHEILASIAAEGVSIFPAIVDLSGGATRAQTPPKVRQAAQIIAVRKFIVSSIRFSRSQTLHVGARQVGGALFLRTLDSIPVDIDLGSQPALEAFSTDCGVVCALFKAWEGIFGEEFTTY
jgi:hypothetical protein